MRTALLCLTAVAMAAAANPFDNGGNWYVNPSFHASLDTSIASSSGAVKTTLESMRDIPSAWWIDVKAKVKGTGTNTVPGILADAASKPNPPLVTFIVYDVPNRDCHAKASNGEICCTTNPDGTCDYLAAGDCSAGLAVYKGEYIDPLVALFAQYQDKVPIVLIIEPDSLPNLATNMDDPRCSNKATQNAYKQGIAYAVNQFAAKVPKATMYLDGAHGGWLGWENNMMKFKDLVNGMGIVSKLRGFATNVANYQPVGEQCPSLKFCTNGQNQGNACCDDPCNVQSEWNLAHNEANYVMLLQSAFPGKKVVIDTGRNGVEDMRGDCSNWCNVRGAGVGRVPSVDTGINGVDAFYWLKTPGESDGCTQQLPSGGQCPRFDDFCGSDDSLGSESGEPRSPEAGNWFDYQIKQLAANANMYPGAPPPTTPSTPPTPVTTPRPATPPVTPPVTPPTPSAPWTAAPGGKTPAPGTCLYGACTSSATCCNGSKCHALMAGFPMGMCMTACSSWDCSILA